MLKSINCVNLEDGEKWADNLWKGWLALLTRIEKLVVRDLDFVSRGALLLEMFDCGKTCGVLPEEKEREGGNSSWQAVTSLHVRVKYQIIEEIFFFPFHFLNMPLENATPSLVDLCLSLNSVSQIGILFDINFYADWKYIITIWKKNENNSSRLIVLLSIFFLFFNFLKYHWIFIDTIRFATRKAPSCVSSIKPNEAFLESIIAGY